MLRSSFFGAAGLALTALPVFALEFSRLTTPTGPGAQEPVLFAMNDGRVAMSWLEPIATGFALKMSIGNKDSWGPARTVHSSDSMFINWADFPSIAVFADGTYAVHWLQDSANTGYAYDVNIALSHDEGVSWNDPITPHRDDTTGQHGFVTLLPLKDGMLSLWLDSRAYKKTVLERQSDFPNAMQFRATEISSDGRLSEDILLDAQTCTCCQTDAAVTGDGDVIAVYRDKTRDEIRDIAVVRLEDDTWSDPEIIHNDGWEISGCPVNGPAIDTYDHRVAVAWFTAPNDDPAVKVALSDDGGRTFSSPLVIDQGDPVGRVDVLMLNEVQALATWVEWSETGEIILSCIFGGEDKCNAVELIAQNDGLGSVNFPNMVRTRDGVYLAWSQPAHETSEEADRDDTIEVRFAPFKN